ncbi:hypothetical protein E2C01_095198 [Portunus trituberculatus]|uniref:Uncharacterized protein n=1 Tax=Portunus trituberculatus TaxID=210409 RepID=A0A5B7JUN4_PORTR|nr:hypothetical protein [Portunus trituberculatus]
MNPGGGRPKVAMSEPTRITSLETCNNSDGEDTENHWPWLPKKAHLSDSSQRECQRGKSSCRG